MTMKGYTLLEMIVAVGIFSIVMTVASGAYLALMDYDREVRATNALTNNLAFAVDSMARSIRTGTLFGCGSTGGASGGTNGTCNSFSFLDAYLNQKVTYIRMSNGTIGRCTGSGTCSDSNAISLTDPAVSIPSGGLTFYVRGIGTGDGVQPQVTFTIKGTMTGSDGRPVDVVLQTSATQRFIDL